MAWHWHLREHCILLACMLCYNFQQSNRYRVSSQISKPWTCWIQRIRLVVSVFDICIYMFLYWHVQYSYRLPANSWGSPKMGTPGPHFPGRMRTRDPYFSVKMGTPCMHGWLYSQDYVEHLAIWQTIITEKWGSLYVWLAFLQAYMTGLSTPLCSLVEKSY